MSIIEKICNYLYLLFKTFTTFYYPSVSTLKAIAHWVWNFHIRFSFFSYSSSFPIKINGCENQKSNLIQIFLFRRQCVYMNVTTWGRIYFSTCENFRRKFQTFTCYNTVLSIFTLKLKKKNVYIFCIVTLFAIIMAIFYNHDMKNIIINTEI